MTHMAMSSIRGMATCSLLGEAVGKAASIAIRENLSPYDVYLKHIVSQICKVAKLNIGGDIIRNGQDRAHKIYGIDEKISSYPAAGGETICYTFDAYNVSAVHLDSPIMQMPSVLCKAFGLYGEFEGKRTEILSVTNNRI